jgi:hypothetical protein
MKTPSNDRRKKVASGIPLTLCGTLKLSDSIPRPVAGSHDLAGKYNAGRGRSDIRRLTKDAIQRRRMSCMEYNQ